MAGGVSVKVSLKYDGKIFEGIDKKKAYRHLRNFIKEKCSGAAGNPLLAHYADGQQSWQEDAPSYKKYKQSHYGTSDKFHLTGRAYKAIKAKTSADKKYTVAYRKKHDYFVMTATIRKMVDGKNVYNFAQNGRFEGISGTSKGQNKTISKGDFMGAVANANKAWKHVQKTNDTGKVKAKGFKAKVIANYLDFDKGSTRRISKNQRLVTANLPGDEKFITTADAKPVIDAILKDSGYTLK